MRVYFKAGPDGHEFGTGWFQFWRAVSGETALVFRMPAGMSRLDVLTRAEAKLDNRGVYEPFELFEADEADVVRWLMAHSKKARLGDDGVIQ